MNAYQFETVIPKTGIVQLPVSMKPLYRHKALITIVDIEKPAPDPIAFFDDIIRRYNELDEPDLDIEDIYAQRRVSDDRNIVFD